MRPLSSKDAIHLVMRSLWAEKDFSFRVKRNHSMIKRLLSRLAREYGVIVYRFAIMSNHIHLALRVPGRECYKTFIRVLCGQIASHVMRGLSFADFRSQALASNLKPTQEPQGLGQKFWQFRPFSRVLHWGRDYKTCCAYIEQNAQEALGFVPYKPRKNAYAKWITESLAGSRLVT